MSAVREIARRAAGFRPQAGLILGSGLNGIAQRISAVATIPYGEIPGFPVPSSASHQGNLVLGFRATAGSPASRAAPTSTRATPPMRTRCPCAR